MTTHQEQLRRTITEIVLQRKGVHDFEAISAQVKAKKDPECVFKIRESYANLKEYETKQRTLLGKLNSGTETEPQQPASIGYVPDFIDEARWLEQIGVGFGEDETYRIFKSLTKWTLKKGAKQMKLWGKILGSHRDYYIAEGVADGGEESGEMPPDAEAKGVGVNKVTYWACCDLSGDWSELPLITPAQLRVSRSIKYLFTGDLTRPIHTNPQFPGKEAHLLRCQIVRISTSCAIVPKGSLVINAENPLEVDVPEDYIAPDVSVLSAKENWVYSSASILKNGRFTLMKPEGLEPDEEQKWMKQAAIRDPAEPRLKSVALDSHHWTLKAIQMDDTAKGLGKVGKTVKRGVVGVKSLVWPGWITLAYGTKQCSLYVGYAHKFKQNYYPFDPEAVLSEAGDRMEYVVKE